MSMKCSPTILLFFSINCQFTQFEKYAFALYYLLRDGNAILGTFCDRYIKFKYSRLLDNCMSISIALGTCGVFNISIIDFHCYQLHACIHSTITFRFRPQIKVMILKICRITPSGSYQINIRAKYFCELLEIIKKHDTGEMNSTEVNWS